MNCLIDKQIDLETYHFEILKKGLYGQFSKQHNSKLVPRAKVGLNIPFKYKTL